MRIIVLLPLKNAGQFKMCCNSCAYGQGTCKLLHARQMHA